MTLIVQFFFIFGLKIFQNATLDRHIMEIGAPWKSGSPRQMSTLHMGKDGSGVSHPVFFKNLKKI